MVPVLYHMLRHRECGKAEDAGGNADDGIAFDWDAMCKELPYLGGQFQYSVSGS
jgi:hypothetical protein